MSRSLQIRSTFVYGIRYRMQNPAWRNGRHVIHFCISNTDYQIGQLVSCHLNLANREEPAHKVAFPLIFRSKVL